MEQFNLLDAPMPDPLVETDAVPMQGIPPQLDLFATRPREEEPPEPPPARTFVLTAPAPPRQRPATSPVEPSPIDPAEAEVAAALPPGIRLGTSSWSFPGWKGLVYDSAYTEERLARDGLRAYAAHPTFRTVALDRGYYAPVPVTAHRDYAEAVPAPFSFVLKALEELMVANFPRHPRYGVRAGKPNPRFLDPTAAIAEVIGPAIEGLGPKLGPIVFQAPPQNVLAMGGTRRTLERLEAFLGALPRGPIYAVEFRNSEFLTADLGAVLRNVGAVPCLSVHPTLPRIGVQAKLLGALEFPTLVLRWLLRSGLSYEAAVERYSPFDRIVDDDPETRASVAAAAFRFFEQDKAAYVIVNNKAEGSSPLSTRLLAGEIVKLIQTRR
jgi:uncharacterized protein YecE (DUF72 family)